MEHLAQAIEQEIKRRLYEEHEGLMLALRSFVCFSAKDPSEQPKFDEKHALNIFSERIRVFSEILVRTHGEVVREMVAPQKAIGKKIIG
ncbi:hypothetical protein ACJVDH_02350 [Pedobacter sp. AW1-32]|uniref:hypothetical protein n=1 Tax=Pedobacter sp. AW1-32 TaxID=3383026 RepID=UPI003FEF4B02